MEDTIVRDNLINEEGYTPYCGNNFPRDNSNGCNNPRTVFNGDQFACPNCNWVSQFPEEFIDRYKTKWDLCKCTKEPMWTVGGKCVTCNKPFRLKSLNRF